MTAQPLTEAQRGALRELLRVERAQVLRRLASLERTFDEIVDAADLEPSDDEHDPRRDHGLRTRPGHLTGR